MSDEEKKDQGPETQEWESPVIPPPIKEKKDGESGDAKEWEPPIGPPAK